MKTNSVWFRERLRGLGAWGALVGLFALPLFALRESEYGDVAGNDPMGNLIIATSSADRELLERMEARCRFARTVLDGHLTLLEGAAGCRELDRRSPYFDRARFRRFAPGKTDEERYCRLVITGVEGLLVSTPDRGARTVRSLNDELATRMRAGTLQFQSKHEGRRAGR